MKGLKRDTILKNAYSHTDLDDISLDSEKSKAFYDTLLAFVIEHPEFKYICGLSAFKDVPGTYVIACLGTNKFKIGYTGKDSDLYESITQEWAKISNSNDMFTYAKVFVNPNTDSIKEIEDIFPAKMIADDYGGTRMNCVEWKERVGEVDKKHVALAAGGILALVGAVSLIKYLVGKHE